MAHAGEYVFREVMHRFSCYTSRINMARHVFAKNMLAVTSDCIKSYDNGISVVLKILLSLLYILGTKN